MIRVLIVDDDAMVAAANKVYLESVGGFTCVGIANNASLANRLLRSEPVDLVLLDIFMPGQSGLDWLRDIRKASRSVDVIVISAASDMARIKTALRLGAVDYLIKPFEFQRFEAAMVAYQHKRQWMEEDVNVSQHQLDSFLHPSDAQATSYDLPKGITKETLQSVLSHIQTLPLEPFTTETLSTKAGISKVSIGKYLRFLVHIGLLSNHLDYRTIGRPANRYQLNPERTEVIDLYL